MNAERLSSLVWLVLGVGSIYAAMGLGVGTPREPGSGFVPFTAGTFICVMAVFVFLQSFQLGQHARRGLASLWQGVLWRRSLAVGVLTLAYILALEALGFTLTGFLLLVIIMRGLERISWQKTLVISTATLAVSYLVFKIFLKATLPTGILGF